MFTNPTPDQLRSLLREVKTIAVVGLSPNVARPSYRVSRAMQGFGYRIVPVRPAVSEVLGEKAYARLSDIPQQRGRAETRLRLDDRRMSEQAPAGHGTRCPPGSRDFLEGDAGIPAGQGGGRAL